MEKVLKNKKMFKFNKISLIQEKTQKGNLFLTIKGKHYDGSLFISHALKKGANYFVTQAI